MKQKFINAYMKVAKTFADLSYARRLHVGAIVVKDDRIISIGFNGMPSGWDNDCENIEYTYDERDTVDGGWTYNKDNKQWSRLKTKPEVLHAEMNALMKLAKSNESGLDSSIFITHSPCLDCAKGIYQAGIKEVYYSTDYRSTDGIDFLNKCGITVTRVKEGE